MARNKRIKGVMYEDTAPIVDLWEVFQWVPPWPRATFRTRVGPAEIRECMRRSANRRALRVFRVNALTKHLKEGRFHSFVSTMAFDQNGLFVDGNNRAAAILKSGATVVVDIKTGLTREEVMVIDDGSARSVADALMVSGRMKKRRGTVGAGLAQVWRMLRGPKCMASPHRPDSLETLELMDEWGKSVLEGAELFGRREYMGAAGEASGIYAFLKTVDEDKAFDFARQVVFGEMLQSDDPAWQLRAKLTYIKTKDPTTSEPRKVMRQIYWMIAWRAFYEGRKLTKLQRAASVDPIPPVSGWKGVALPWEHSLNLSERIPDFDEERFGHLLITDDD